LEYAVRNITYNLGGTIFSTQYLLLAFADDICIVARNPRTLTDAFNETASTKSGLQANISKTKYLICIPNKVTLPKSLAVENHIFGRTDVLKHLRVLVTTDNVVTKEIQARLTATIDVIMPYRLY
jgi:hypothetical protein